jgi:hypothetical protein
MIKKYKLFVLVGIVLFSFLNFTALYNSSGDSNNTIRLILPVRNTIMEID